MEPEKRFAVIRANDLKWPDDLKLPSTRFRVFVAANTIGLDAQTLSDFAFRALNHGMVYFCSWGPDCSRFHDIVDQVIVKDDLDEHKFSGPNSEDVIMTTWHADESLEEAINFFATCAAPTDGFAQDSDFRLVISVGNNDWATEAEKFLGSAKFFI